ncbi:MAG TPA: hypothetical protein VF043_15225 [Ktedonobacteraceae bacterium]
MLRGDPASSPLHPRAVQAPSTHHIPAPAPTGHEPLPQKPTCVSTLVLTRTLVVTRVAHSFPFIHLQGHVLWSPALAC